MAKVNERIRVWNDTMTDCEICLPGREIDGDLLKRAVAQGFDPETGTMGPVEEKRAAPPANKSNKSAPENK
jgi:hypothetical protein